MKLLCIRADGNSEIGMGHIMRSIAIAEAALKLGISVLFITADHNADKVLEKKKLRCKCLGTDWRNKEQEAEILKCFISMQHGEKILLVDSYTVTKDYFRKLHGVCKIMYMDDWAQELYPVDFIINYNIYAEKLPLYKTYTGSATSFLLGSRYIPLGQEFQSLNKPIVRHNLRDILVTTGGTDEQDLCTALVKRVREDKRLHNWKYHIVIGPYNPNTERLEKCAANFKNIVLHTNVINMYELMCECDAAFSSAGSTLYELCACGVPTLSVVVSEDQQMNAEEFSRQEIIACSGVYKTQDPERFFDCLYDFLCKMASQQKRKEQAKKMRKIVDGKGAERICSHI